jgi:hypothetical protein
VIGLNALPSDSHECHVIQTLENTQILLGSRLLELMHLFKVSQMYYRNSSSLRLRPPSHLDDVILLGDVIKGTQQNNTSLAARYSLRNLPTAQATSIDCGLNNTTPRSHRVLVRTHLCVIKRVKQCDTLLGYHAWDI